MVPMTAISAAAIANNSLAHSNLTLKELLFGYSLGMIFAAVVMAIGFYIISRKYRR